MLPVKSWPTSPTTCQETSRHTNVGREMNSRGSRLVPPPADKPPRPRVDSRAYINYPLARSLSSVLGQFRQLLAMALGGSDNFHLLPIVGELLAAIEANHIRSRQRSGLGAARCPTHGYRKAIASVPASEKRIHEFSDHVPPSIPGACMFEPWETAKVTPPPRKTVSLVTHILRFTDCQKGLGFQQISLVQREVRNSLKM